jgi:hypothetical protein
MADNLVDSAFDIDALLAGLTKSLQTAAQKLSDSFRKDKEWNEPYIYQIPRMQVSVKLSLSYSQGKVKGLLSQHSTSEEQSLVSTLDLDIVAVPRREPRAVKNESSLDDH